MELKQKLMEEARRKGICGDGYRYMRNCDRDRLIDCYVTNPDWCMERDYPTLPFLRENFSDIEDKGVFVDKTFHGETLNVLQAYIFHNCKGTIKVGLNTEKAIIPMLYLANGCRLRIIGAGDYVPKKPSDVPIYTFGKNDVSAKNNKYVTFRLYKNELIKNKDR